MSIDREAIVASLFDYIVFQVPHFKTTGRRLLMWSDEYPQPALFMRHTADDDQSALDPLQRDSIELELWIYSKAGADPAAQPDVELNRLVKMIRDALAPDDDDRQVFTLGGTVWACGIQGRSERDPGDMDNQSKAVLPIKIILP